MLFCLLRVSFGILFRNDVSGRTRTRYSRDCNKQSFRRRRVFVLAFIIVSLFTQYSIIHCSYSRLCRLGDRFVHPCWFLSLSKQVSDDTELLYLRRTERFNRREVKGVFCFCFTRQCTMWGLGTLVPAPGAAILRLTVPYRVGTLREVGRHARNPATPTTHQK
jgi:hypothetical protein